MSSENRPLSLEEKLSRTIDKVKKLEDKYNRLANSVFRQPGIAERNVSLMAQVERLKMEPAVLIGELIAVGLELENLDETPELRHIHDNIIEAIKNAEERGAEAETS